MRPHPRDEEFFQQGLNQWGENWRGNWAPRRGSFEVPVPDLSNLSAHEKLEAALVLRQWLKDKMPDEEIETIFQSVNMS